MLGIHTMNLLCPDPVAGIPEFIEAVRRHVTASVPD